jgi:hypothetical protein
MEFEHCITIKVTSDQIDCVFIKSFMCSSAAEENALDFYKNKVLNQETMLLPN